MDSPTARLVDALRDTYTVDRELGGGGMSRTYLATERALQRQVVIKVLAPELLAGLSVERFRREVLLAARLQHPHIVPVLAAGDVGGLPWFSMPYVAGDSLRQRLAHGPLPITETVTVLRDVARALAFAHAAGVVHRDIKPDNVLLAAGSATVTDFGIAKAVNAARTGVDEANAVLTKTGMSIGTPAYMAPEQAAGDPATDQRADLYSFGCLAFELLAGRPPFSGGTPATLITQHMTAPAPDVRTLRPDTPAALAELIAACLRKNPKDRPAQAAELVQVLDATASGEGAPPAALAGPRVHAAQALGAWAFGAGGLVGATWGATVGIGLPDWAMPAAVGLALAALPVVFASLVVQHTVREALAAASPRTPGGTVRAAGTLQTLAFKASPALRWDRLRRSGVIAGVGFALFVTGFMVTRALGIGPAASLQGAGIFGREEMLVVADFRSAADSALGATVAEALRTDLAQSRSLRVLSRQTLNEVLRLMQQPGRAPGFEIAREIAIREGAKAVLDGELVRIGDGYVVSARLVNAQDGTELATFRRTADSERDLLGAIGDLARDVRSKAGDNLKAIRASEPLERVTTASLPALRKYVEGNDLMRRGDEERGMALLGEAVRMDTAFAMAWRSIAVRLVGDGRERRRIYEALDAAMRHRDRLTELERALLEGDYYRYGPRPDYPRALAAYDEVVRLDSTHRVGLSGSAGVLSLLGREEEAIARLEAVSRLPRPALTTFLSLTRRLAAIGRGAEVPAIAARARALFRDSPSIVELDFNERLAMWDFAGADSAARTHVARFGTGRNADIAAYGLSMISFMQGRDAEGLRWMTFADGLALRASGRAADRFRLSLDTLFALSLRPGGTAAFRAAAARTLALPVLDSVPPESREWGLVALLALHAGDAATVRRAAERFATDGAAFSADSAVSAAGYFGYAAFAEGRWADARRDVGAALAGRVNSRELNLTVLALAHAAEGRPDSAAAYLTTLTRGVNYYPEFWAVFFADLLDRMGAWYESKGRWREAYDATERYVAMRRNADPHHVPALRAARERLVRLRAKMG